MILKCESLLEEQKLFAEHIGIKVGDEGYSLKTVASDCLFVELNSNTVTIGYSKPCEIFRGIALLKEGIYENERKEERAQFDALAALIDCSRNAVPTVKMLKQFVMDIAALGYNQLYLYTEDTFEIKDYPYFGHWRGRYSADEIRELDLYAKKFGIELIPAVQTLAHFNTVFHWNAFDAIHDTSDILLCGNEKTYEFLDKMLASLRSMYTTDKINIGMDEAHMLGLGKYLESNGYHDKMDIFLKHISRIMELVNKYGFNPIMWSDMFFKISCGKCNYDKLEVAEFSEDILNLIPKNMSLAYWNYSPHPEEYYDAMFKAHIKMDREIIFTGGFRKWVGFCPNLQFSFDASRTALNTAVKYGIKKVIITGWGDNGAEGSAYLMLPGLALYSEMCYKNDMSDEAISHRLSALYGYTLDDFRLLEKPNLLPGASAEEKTISANPNKVLLWNDPMLGQYDRHIANGTNEIYAKIAEELKTLKMRNKRFDYVFETVCCLCEVLSIKSELGIKLYDSYSRGAKEELLNLKTDIYTLIEKLDVFHKVFRKNWLKENKIFGFDVQDIRFGSLRARLVYVADALESYLNGETESIPELEEERLYMDCRQFDDEYPLHRCFNIWHKIVTVNVL